MNMTAAIYQIKQKLPNIMFLKQTKTNCSETPWITLVRPLVYLRGVFAEELQMPGKLGTSPKFTQNGTLSSVPLDQVSVPMSPTLIN